MGSHGGISVFIRRGRKTRALSSSLLPHEDAARKPPSASQETALTRNQIDWHLDLGLPRLQNSEKQMSFV